MLPPEHIIFSKKRRLGWGEEVSWEVIKDIAEESVMSCRISHHTFRVKLYQAGCRALLHSPFIVHSSLHAGEALLPLSLATGLLLPSLLTRATQVRESRNCLDHKYILPGPHWTLRCAAHPRCLWSCAAPLVPATAPTGCHTGRWPADAPKQGMHAASCQVECNKVTQGASVNRSSLW